MKRAKKAPSDQPVYGMYFGGNEKNLTLATDCIVKIMGAGGGHEAITIEALRCLKATASAPSSITVSGCSVDMGERS